MRLNVAALPFVLKGESIFEMKEVAINCCEVNRWNFDFASSIKLYEMNNSKKSKKSDWGHQAS